jgi:hypothetical protein
MAQKKVKTRIQNKYDTLENWNEAGKNNFVPLKGELIFAPHPASSALPPLVKVGNGDTVVNDLSFLGVPRVYCMNANGSIGSGDPYDVLAAPQTDISILHNTYGLATIDCCLNNYDLDSDLIPNYHAKHKVLVSFSNNELEPDEDGFKHLIIDFSLTSGGRQKSNLLIPEENLFIYFRPDRCLTKGWGLDNTVASTEYQTPITSYVADEEECHTSFCYKVYPPAGLPSNASGGNGKYLLVIDVEIYRSDDPNLMYICLKHDLNIGSFEKEV